MEGTEVSRKLTSRVRYEQAESRSSFYIISLSYIKQADKSITLAARLKHEIYLPLKTWYHVESNLATG
jgi:hypothetical protein